MNLLSSYFFTASIRGISTSASCYGKRNFRKFLLYNKRGSKVFKRQQAQAPDPEMPSYTRGVREIGRNDGKRFVIVPEMIPELIVPDLSGFELKPYVSYKAPDVYQSEFTAKDLFDAMYSSKIMEDLKSGKITEDSNLTCYPEGSLTPEEAWKEARKTGSDIF